MLGLGDQELLRVFLLNQRRDLKICRTQPRLSGLVNGLP
jgi:hypothetical protein